MKLDGKNIIYVFVNMLVFMIIQFLSEYCILIYTILYNMHNLIKKLNFIIG